MDSLNQKQKEAVLCTEGPLLILAGAGSGKTRVLTYRIAHMIGDLNIAPWNILAITFTNKAAAEMRERLHNLIGEQSSKVWAKTFHSAALLILRMHIDLLGYDKAFNIYDTQDSTGLIKRCMDQLNIDSNVIKPREALLFISRSKDQLKTPVQVEQEVLGEYRNEMKSKIYTMYQRKLKDNNAIDFDDIIQLTVKLFTDNPDILEMYQNRFRYILVDEYQDTNHAQYKLITMLASKYRNICVVGDDDQSIYRFRGADIKNILNFEKDYPEAKVVALEQNYRSTGNILDAANKIIAKNKTRKSKQLWTSSDKGAALICHCAANERKEAEYVVEQIRKIGCKLSDIAILYRMNAQSRAIEEALLRAATPYRLLSGLRFYDRKEIKDIIAYLKLVNNNTDNVSLRRIINEPRRGIGVKTLDDIETEADKLGVSMYEYIQNNPSPKTNEFVTLIEELKEIAAQNNVEDTVDLTIRKCGYLLYINKAYTEDEAQSRRENLDELISACIDYDEKNPEGDLSGFLDNITLVSDVDNYDEREDTVTLLTVHSAKGLEFPVVFLVGMEEGVFPGERCNTYPEELEEERRLCYVAVTRAREQLHITHAYTRTLFGKTTRNYVSRFVDDIPGGIIDKTSSDQIQEMPQQKGLFGRTSGPNKNEVSIVPSSRPASVCTIEPNQRVRHSKFGEGLVVSVTKVGNDHHLAVKFDNFGVKQLLALYAKLEVIEK